MKSEIKILSRKEVSDSDKWDLSGLFKNEDDWEENLIKLETELMSNR